MINIIRVVPKPDDNPKGGNVLGVAIIKKARHVDAGDRATRVAKKAMKDTVAVPIGSDNRSLRVDAFGVGCDSVTEPGGSNCVMGPVRWRT